MSTPVSTVGDETDIAEIAGLLTAHQINSTGVLGHVVARHGILYRLDACQSSSFRDATKHAVSRTGSDPSPAGARKATRRERAVPAGKQCGIVTFSRTAAP